MANDKTRWEDDGCGDVADAMTGEMVALVMGSRHLKTHKTRLIAAAPEMLEILQGLQIAEDYSYEGTLQMRIRLNKLATRAAILIARITGNESQ